ncbi:hypothetical protein E1B28_003331 [Marasmius oreades]|uniref:Uncharacterized protein n=1 Tax=Marasmius oreades TaxID=181124 RepID=A0A9P7UKM6_9AGAR|nr:uncharacterized protein E1B28_003331 [Marasmius oreades]KAG7085790.1 hypothetical protein E1B28_003331 [Marasmius oreades]
MVETRTSAQAPPHPPIHSEPSRHSPPTSPSPEPTPDENDLIPAEILTDWVRVKSHPYIGDLYKVPYHHLVPADAVGQVYVLVTSLTKGNFRKLQRMESSFKAPATAGDLPDYFHFLDPLTDKGVILRDRYGNGSEDRWVTYCNGPNNYGVDLFARAQKLTTDITGPLHAVEPGPKGTAFERQGRAIRLVTGPRCYSLGVMDQTQRSLEAPAARGKVFNHDMADPALRTHTDILGLGAELSVQGIKRFEPEIYAKHAVQSELVNAPRVGNDSNVMFARAQLNLATPNDKDCEEGDQLFEVGESSSDESNASPSEDDRRAAPPILPSDQDSSTDLESSERLSITRRSKRLRKGKAILVSQGGAVRKAAAKPAKKGLAKSLGRFGAPHNDPRDSPTMKSALTSLSPSRRDVEPDYFLIVEIGIAWRVRAYTTTFFSGLYLHTGMPPQYVTSGKKEGSAEHVQINLVMYPARAQLEGTSSQALFALPKPVINNLAVVTQEMRKPWVTTTGNVFCNSTTLSTDGAAYMEPESLLRQVSRSMYHYALAILQQSQVQLLLRIDHEMFLKSISFWIGNERVAADSNWTYGPCWSGEDVTPGIKAAYSDDRLPTTPEGWAALFNSDTPTDVPFGNQNIPRAVNEWEDLKREVGSTIPYWALKAHKAASEQESAQGIVAKGGQRKGKKKVVEALDINIAYARGRPTSKISTSRRKPWTRKPACEHEDADGQGDKEAGLDGGSEEGRHGEDNAGPSGNYVGDGDNENILGEDQEGMEGEARITGGNEHGTDGGGSYNTNGDTVHLEGGGEEGAAMDVDHNHSIRNGGHCAGDLLPLYRDEPDHTNTVCISAHTQNVLMGRSEPQQLSALAPTVPTYPLPYANFPCNTFVECLSPVLLQRELDNKVHLTSQLPQQFPRTLEECLPRPDASITTWTASYHSLLSLDVHVQLTQNIIHLSVMLINLMICEWISDTIRGLFQPGSGFNRLYQRLKLWVETQTGPVVLDPSDYFPDLVFGAEGGGQVDLRHLHPQTTCYALAANHLAIRVLLRWICWPTASYRVSMHRAHFTRLLLNHIGPLVLWLEGTYHAWTKLDIVNAPVTMQSLSTWAQSVLASHNICLKTSQENILLQKIDMVMSSRALGSTTYNYPVQGLLVSMGKSLGRVDTLDREDLYGATDTIIGKLSLDRYYCKLRALLPLTLPPYLGIVQLMTVVEDQPSLEWVQFVQYVVQDADKRLPFRDLAPSRKHILSYSSTFSSPYRVPHLRTKEGFFSALIYRGITHNTQFLLSKEYPRVFHDLEHWLAVYIPLQALHSKQYFCNMQAYFTPCPSRSVDNVTRYWQAAQRHDLTQWLTGTQMAFGTVYRLLHKGTIPAGVRGQRHVNAFPGMGSLSIYLLCADYAAAGVIAMPTFDELARVMLEVKGGALKGLRNLGFQCDSVEETSAALSAVDSVLKDLFEDAELAQMNYSLLTLEHSLCKDGILEGSAFDAVYCHFVDLHGSAEGRWN